MRTVALVGVPPELPDDLVDLLYLHVVVPHDGPVQRLVVLL